MKRERDAVREAVYCYSRLEESSPALGDGVEEREKGGRKGSNERTCYQERGWEGKTWLAPSAHLVRSQTLAILKSRKSIHRLAKKRGK